MHMDAEQIARLCGSAKVTGELRLQLLALLQDPGPPREAVRTVVQVKEGGSSPEAESASVPEPLLRALQTGGTARRAEVPGLGVFYELDVSLDQLEELISCDSVTAVGRSLAFEPMDPEHPKREHESGEITDDSED